MWPIQHTETASTLAGIFRFSEFSLGKQRSPGWLLPETAFSIVRLVEELRDFGKMAMLCDPKGREQGLLIYYSGELNTFPIPHKLKEQDLIFQFIPRPSNQTKTRLLYELLTVSISYLQSQTNASRLFWEFDPAISSWEKVADEVGFKLIVRQPTSFVGVLRL